ncbi:hypothetical protein ZWY2020_004580 [Hordeum vulgare]|nr:hypothetical protein ZWY2020_004580 [Hordeum vulgare]
MERACGHARHLRTRPTQSVAHAAKEERHGRAEHGGNERRGDSRGTGSRARRGLVGGQSGPAKQEAATAAMTTAGDLGGHDPSREKEKCRGCGRVCHNSSSKGCGGGGECVCERDNAVGTQDGARVFIADDEEDRGWGNGVPCILQSG